MILKFEKPEQVGNVRTAYIFDGYNQLHLVKIKIVKEVTKKDFLEWIAETRSHEGVILLNDRFYEVLVLEDTLKSGMINE